jgi:hypothetical protein
VANDASRYCPYQQDLKAARINTVRAHSSKLSGAMSPMTKLDCDRTAYKPAGMVP